MQRVLTAGSKAIDVVGGAIPVTSQEFALRAYRAATNPLANPVKEVQDTFSGGIDAFRLLKADPATPPHLPKHTARPFHTHTLHTRRRYDS